MVFIFIFIFLCKKILTVVTFLQKKKKELASDFAEFGSAMNNFSLTEKELGPSLEKFGATFDSCFLAIRFAVHFFLFFLFPLNKKMIN